MTRVRRQTPDSPFRMKLALFRHRILWCILFASLASALPAAARDSLNQVCIGFITLENRVLPKSIEKLVVVYKDHRSGADKREISLSISRAGGNTIYHGTTITSLAVAHVKIVNDADQNDVLFDGTVEAISGGIELIGKYFTADNPKGQSIKATLECNEIP